MSNSTLTDQETKPRVVVIGATHVDRIGRLDRAASDGASVPGKVTQAVGGAALNVASNLGVLGANVMLAGIVGNDSDGDRVRHALDERPLIAKLQTADVQTASYTAILQPDGDLVIALADMDIHAEFDTQAILPELEALQRQDWLVVDANLDEATLSALPSGQCNLAALSVSTAKAERLRGIAGKIDLLFTNRREAFALAGRDVDGTMDDAQRGLRELGVARAVISDGSAALAVLDGNRGHEIDIPRSAKVVDVTGAGDALAAGTLCRVMLGDTLKDAVATGIAAAQAIVQVNGPWRADLLQALGQCFQTGGE